MTRRAVRLAAPAALLTFMASACLSVPGDVVLPARVAAEHAATGGTLRVGIEPPGSIHPTLASSPSATLISSLVCDTLVHIDPATGDVLPALAEQFVVSTDGKALTFKLRRGITMHDGSELTARDVVASIHRVADPNEGSYMHGLLDGIVGFGQFSGRDLEDGQSRPSQMAGVETLEKYGLQVRLVTSEPQFVRRFAHAALAPLSEDAYEANPLALARDPVCAGPYAVDGTYDPDANIVRLVRDEDFTGHSPALSNAGEGYADVIEFHVRPDADAVLAAYEAGEVDVARLPTTRFTEVGDARGGDVVEGPDPTIEYVGLPVAGLDVALGIDVGARERFDELALRHALSLALDRSVIAAALHDGARSPATSLTSPSVGRYHVRDRAVGSEVDLGDLPGSSTDAAIAASRGTPFCDALLPSEGDLDGALRLLTEETITGPDGPTSVSLRGRTLPFYFNDEFGNAAFVDEVAAQLERAFGLRIEPVALTWDEFLDRANSGGGFDGLYRLSWQDPGLAATGYLRAVADTTGAANLGRFSDETIQRIFAELGEVGGEDHRFMFQVLEDAVCAMAPAIPVTYAHSRWLVRGEAVGVARDEVVGWDGQVLLRELYVGGRW